MRATKYTMTVVSSVLSVDSIPALLEEVATAIRKENVAGVIRKSDGDSITWEAESKDVDF